MKKMRRVTRIIPVLVLLALLASLVPLAGTACSEDEEDLVADFLGAPTAGTVPLEVSFVDKSTGDAESWAWTFGDGETSTAQHPTHTYAAEGVYDVSLTVTKGDKTDTETKTGYIEVADIVAEFSAEPTSGEVSAAVSLPVQFSDLSVGTITSWQWDLDGDGLPDSTDQNPSHTYTTAGTYDISLRVEGPDGVNTETKTGYITVSDHVYPTMTLRLSHGMQQMQTGSKVAQLWADKVEEYTGGAVTVDVWPAGTLIGYVEELEAVMAGGTVDVTWTSPFFLRGLNPSLDWVGSIPNIFYNLAHCRAVHDDGRLNEFTAGELEAMGIHLLGYFETTHMGAYFNQVGPVITPSDMAGWELGMFATGTLNAFEQVIGMSGHFVQYADLFTEILNGSIDVMTNSVDAHVNWGFVNYLKYSLSIVSMGYHTPLVNLAKWNSFDEHLQALINDVINPVVQEFARNESTEDEKKYWLMAVQQMDSCNVMSLADVAAMYEAMVATQAYQDLLGNIDPLIIQVIEEYRPATPTWDQDILDVLNFAGIPIPG